MHSGTWRDTLELQIKLEEYNPLEQTAEVAKSILWHIQIVSRFILDSLHSTFGGGLEYDSKQITIDASQSGHSGCSHRI